MALQRIDTAYGPNPVRFNGNIQPQANANVFLGNTSFQFSTIYASTFNGTATHANLAYFLGSGTAINPSSANVAGNIVGYATTITANVSTGAIVSRGGLGVAGVGMFGGNIVAASNTASTSTTTGALVVVGGTGVSGAIYNGGVHVSSGNIVAASGTASTNTTTGALVVAGGAGVSGALYTGGIIDAAGNIVADSGTASSSTTTGALIVNGGAGVSGAIYNGGVHVSSGNIVAASGTASTSTTTGALIVNGGAGISGAINAGSFNKLTITAPATSATLTVSDGKTLSVSNTLTFTGTDASSVAFGAGGNVAYTANKLSVFAATTSAELAGVISDETGSGALVFGTSPTFTTQITTPAIVKSGTNAVGNIGQTDNRFNTVFATATSALYADLAENYQADADYEPGTVLEFGGVAEVTIAEDGTRRVAGVVSTKPAHLMNTGLQGVNVVPIALQGRTPCKVRGKIQKGDMLVSAGSGFARPDTAPQTGSVIGKSLEDFDDVEGVVEVVVGRL